MTWEHMMTISYKLFLFHRAANRGCGRKPITEFTDGLYNQRDWKGLCQSIESHNVQSAVMNLGWTPPTYSLPHSFRGGRVGKELVSDIEFVSLGANSKLESKTATGRNTYDLEWLHFKSQHIDKQMSPPNMSNSYDKQLRRAALCISYKANVIPPEAHSGLGITNYRSLFVLRTHR